jgi:hypothetical protein
MTRLRTPVAAWLSVLAATVYCSPHCAFLPIMSRSIRSVAVMVVAGGLVAGIPVFPVVSLRFSPLDAAIGRCAGHDRARCGALTNEVAVSI